MSRTTRRCEIWSYSSVHRLTLLNIFLIILKETLTSPYSHLTCSGTAEWNECACEYQNFAISCTKNSVIRIFGANYGRLDNETCNDQGFLSYALWNLNCRSSISTDVVAERCNNRTDCIIFSSDGYNILFGGDPCPGVVKYLIVNYTCEPEQITSISSSKEFTSPIQSDSTGENLTSEHRSFNAATFSTEAFDEVTTASTNAKCQCPNETKRKVDWPVTVCDNQAKQSCPNNKIRTKAIRYCSKDGWRDPDLIGCIIGEIDAMAEELETLKTNFSIALTKEMMTRVENISKSNDLYGGDLYELAKIMVELAELDLKSRNFTSSDANYLNNLVISSTSSLLSNGSIEAWNELLPSNQSQTATRLLLTMEDSSEILAKATVSPRSLNKTAPGIDALQIDVINVSEEAVRRTHPTFTFKASDSQFEISLEDVTERAQDGLGRTAFIQYNDIAKWLHISKSNDSVRQTPNDTDEKGNETQIEPYIITKVVSASIISYEEHSTKLKNPIRFTLNHKSEPMNSTMPSCVFWKFSKKNFDGHWSNEGCRVVSYNRDNTTCECDHLTFFSVLMSVVKVPSKDVFVLSLLTFVGINVSVVALILTIIVYAVTWKEVKSNQAAVLLNLCVALIAANVSFLNISTKAHSKIGCKAVAVFIHYFYLAAFFLMLVEGIQLLVYVIFVFRTKRKFETSLLLVAAWVVPLIIVAISLGVTKGDGYGNGNICWLSVENNLIWTFIGPVLGITGVNTIIIAIVLVRISTNRLPTSDNNNRTKIRRIIWNLAATCPILGITWCFGVFTGFSIIVEYIFTIVNSLQGLFIFVFHVLFNGKRFNGRLSSFVSRCICLNRNTKLRKGTKEDFQKAANCSKELHDRNFQDTVEIQTISIDSSTAFTRLSSDKSYSESVVASNTVTDDTSTNAITHQDLQDDSSQLLWKL